MKCVDCEYHIFFAGTHWCGIYKKHKRIDEVDAHKDVPCYKYDRRKGVSDGNQST